MRIKLSHPDCKPHVEVPEAAGMDLRAYFGDRASDLLRAIPPGEALMIDTGVAVEIPEGLGRNCGSESSLRRASVDDRQYNRGD